MSQLFPDLPAPRVADTSLEGFARIRKTLHAKELRVFRGIWAYVNATGHEDVTGGELAAFLGMSVLQVRPRYTGLLEAGYVEKGPARKSRAPGEARCHGVRPVVPLAAVDREQEISGSR